MHWYLYPLLFAGGLCVLYLIAYVAAAIIIMRDGRSPNTFG